MLESPSQPAGPDPLRLRLARLGLNWRHLVLLPALLTLGTLLSGGGFRILGVRLAGVELPMGRKGPLPAISQASPSLEVRYLGVPLVSPGLEVDGKAVALQGGGLSGRFQARTGPLAEGRHELALRNGSEVETWPFQVDTRPPRARLLAPEAGAWVSQPSVVLRGQAEPGAALEARAGDSTVRGQAGPGGTFALQVPLRKGRNAVGWEARDGAGNRTSGQVEVGCDPTPPEVQVRLAEAAPDSPAEPVVKTPSPTLVFRASDPESDLSGLEVLVDGGSPQALPLPGAGGSSTLRLERLADGRRHLEVAARNRAGGETRQALDFLVDSTEDFGKATLTLGARGRDVEELQKRLAARGYLRQADVAGCFGEPTRQAVLALQEESGLRADGLVGPFTIGALGSSIYVNLQRFSLVLVDWKGKVRTYPIAHGRPEFPTPTGSFSVIDMTRNPTWIPPNSPWAREAKVTPPGQGNPLGTRWIGLNNGVVGIHGTPADWSIGSRASHGCIRLTIPDIEDLYEHVDVGTRVQILAGTEDDPVLKKYWP